MMDGFGGMMAIELAGGGATPRDSFSRKLKHLSPRAEPRRGRFAGLRAAIHVARAPLVGRARPRRDSRRLPTAEHRHREC